MVVHRRHRSRARHLVERRWHVPRPIPPELEGRCFNCLSWDHVAAACRESSRCYRCKRGGSSGKGVLACPPAAARGGARPAAARCVVSPSPAPNDHDAWRPLVRMLLPRLASFLRLRRRWGFGGERARRQCILGALLGPGLGACALDSPWGMWARPVWACLLPVHERLLTLARSSFSAQDSQGRRCLTRCLWSSLLLKPLQRCGCFRFVGEAGDVLLSALPVLADVACLRWWSLWLGILHFEGIYL
ncbi:hypothetical protein BS78_05G077800 [Paspalum vaginatum]|nr:hypothetical protein BS78_05G077800 [Paspalum vaginatum]